MGVLVGALAPVGAIALRAVRGLLLRPAQVAAAHLLEKILEFRSRVFLCERVFGLCHHVQVHQRQRDGVQPPRLAHQPAIDLELRPVQGLVVPGDGVDAAAESLDFFELVFLRVVAVGAAAHVQALPVA